MAKKKPAPEKKKGGRRPILDPVLVSAALERLQGNIMATARRFKVSRASVQELIGKHPPLQAVLNDAREGMTDEAESSLNKAVKGGEAWAVCFYLKTQGKSRGYVERTEQETTLKGSVDVNHTLKQPVPPSPAVQSLLDHLGLQPPGELPEPLRTDGGSKPLDTARSNGKAGHVSPAG